MSIGVEKRLDELGRVVIPKGLRDFYHLNDKITLVETERGILITNPQYVMVKVKEK